ncbi:cold-inducible protein YdjO-related protein [Priestia megaterium]|uniref:cold-inducible protein YdjO-related protein n=1 Tax=Priestia megaterium TaxID=1404 RepID=UPI003671EDFC
MHYSKRNQEPPIQEETEIWECTVEECKGWMRKDFSYDSHQKCPLCKSQMEANNGLLIKSLVIRIEDNINLCFLKD